MEHLSSVLVCLDFSKKDKSALFCAVAFAKKESIKKLVLFHVIDKKSGSEDGVETAFEQLNKSVRLFPESSSLRIETEVRFGDPLDEILKIVNERSIRLVVCGKSIQSGKHDVLPFKLARKVTCSLLLVPEGFDHAWDNILVPIDYSEASKEAAEMAALLCSANSYSKLVLMRALSLPHGSKISMGANGVVDLKVKERETLTKFVEGADLRRVRLETSIISNQSPPDAILEAARLKSSDLIVMGSKGKGAVAATLLGSTVATVAQESTHPVMIVKRLKKAP